MLYSSAQSFVMVQYIGISPGLLVKPGKAFILITLTVAVVQT